MSEVKGILLARAHTSMPKLSVNKTLPQQITDKVFKYKVDILQSDPIYTSHKSWNADLLTLLERPI